MFTYKKVIRLGDTPRCVYCGGDKVSRHNAKNKTPRLHNVALAKNPLA